MLDADVCSAGGVAFREMSLYALNLFDIADNEDYLAYSRRSPAAVTRHGGRVVALGMHARHSSQLGDTEPRQALVLVEWRDREAFDGFLDDPELADLHPLRENGTSRYIWWMFDRIDDLRPLLRS
jgi:uncharacterized protein (DUF1330 family)